MLTIDQATAIIEMICSVSGVKVEDALSSSRRRENFCCRAIIALCLREVFDYSYREVKLAMRCRTAHSYNAIVSFKELIKTDQHWRTVYLVCVHKCEVIRESNNEADLWFEVGKQLK